MATIQVTSQEFRARQASLFELADQGEEIIIRRGKKQAYTLTPVEANEEKPLSPETERSIAIARQEYAEGKTTVCRTIEEAIKHLESL